MSRLLWLPDVIRDAGFDIHVEPGWETRGKTFYRSVKGVVCHHTATPQSRRGDYPSLQIVRDGRVDVPGPLSQLGLGRSGKKVYIIASGRANHAGAGSWPGFYGNTDLIGIEAEHPGGSYGWPVDQYDAYVVLVEVLLKQLGKPAANAIGHKEWAPTRKVDPNFSMDRFRKDVEMIQQLREIMPYLQKLRGSMDESKASHFDPAVDKARAIGMYSQYTRDDDPLTAAKLATFLDRAKLLEPAGPGDSRDLVAREMAQANAGVIARIRKHLQGTP